MNRVRLNGRFGHRTLSPGTYEVVVVARRGKAQKQVGRIAIQVVLPGSRVRRPGSAPVFSCTPFPLAQSGVPGADLFVSPPGQNRGAPQASRTKPQKTTTRSGVLAAPPFHIGSGGTGLLLTALLYGTLGLGGVVLLAYVVRYFRDPWRQHH